jgi:Protein of unknown function (DUF1501)
MSAGISRREAVRRGLFGGAALVFGSRLQLPAWAATLPAKATAKAKAVIQIWMWGGPPHLDTFDPKPDAGRDYTGDLTKPIETNVSGIRIGELLPMLAKQADKYAIIRSMTHGNNGHETAAYMVQTGRPAGDKQVYPCAGAVVSLYKGYEAGYKGMIPPYVVLTSPQGRFSEAGFLGQRYKPFATGGDPSQTRFAVEGIVAQGVTDDQQRSRRELLHQLNTLGQAVPDNAQLQVLTKTEDQAYDMILGEGAKVFDLATEKDEVRQAYGRNRFGQSCLMARRLVEIGVPYITINYGGWDTHKQHFQAMRQKLPEMDRGFATLLRDLSDRGLLDSTIVWWSGEFGRTPKVDWPAPWNGGRGHYGKCFCAVLAGGGFKGGQVVGASDDRGENVKDRPVYPGDVVGSMYQLLGIDPDAKLPHPQGLEVHLTPTAAEGAKSGGRLTEIM